MKKNISLTLAVVCLSTASYSAHSESRSISPQVKGYSIGVTGDRSEANVILTKRKDIKTEWNWDGSHLRLVVFDYPSFDLPRAIESRYCLNAYRPRKRSNVNIYPCGKSDSEQRWEWVSGGLIKLSSKNLCLNSYKTDEGSNLNLWPCDPSDPDQKFRTIKNTGPIEHIETLGRSKWIN